MRSTQSTDQPLWMMRWKLCEMSVKVRLLAPNTTLIDADGLYQFDKCAWCHYVSVRLVRRSRNANANIAATIGVAAHEFEHVASTACAIMRVMPRSLRRINELRAYIIQTLVSRFSLKLISTRSITK